MPDSLPLAGLTIAVTRPRQQGESTAKMLREAGADVIELPVLEIVPVDCQIDANLLAQVYAVIFVSANAVEHGVPCLRRNGGLHDGILIAAIGQATKQALHEAGFADVVSPQQSIDSEGLLAMPQLQPAQVKGQHVVLARGKSTGGGRKLIEETLIARDAEVAAVECYERRALVLPASQIERLVEAAMRPGLAVMALSVETLENLMNAMAGHETILKSTALLVPHARVAAAATAQGFSNVHEIAVSSELLIPSLLALKPRLVASHNYHG